MPFMSKEELEEKAAELGVVLSDYETWSEKQKAVQAAMREPREETKELLGKDFDNDVIVEKIDETWKEIDRIIESGEEYVPKMIDTGFVPGTGYKPGKVKISSEIPQLKCNTMKYEEELGDAYDSVDAVAHFGMFGSDDRVEQMSRTYEIKRRAGKKVVAQSTAPTVNVQITYDPRTDWFPVCEFNRKRGYLFTHHTLMNVKSSLIESGYWEKYRDKFDGSKHPENVWCAGTKILCCSIPLVDYIIKEINGEERKNANRS